ncbi:MAG: trypsin-like peptidase domain-containing protein [Alphaproteobacteria bacterium]|nr:trypsin-like peptidase domain-containing protein [Alphaproteobacteria bacterium]MBL7096140.1 trypsin-like peptidase domain-containing protein [Alphaproteobacteria bacterium]
MFYLFGKNPKTGKIQGPKGTGVFVSRPASADLQPFSPHIYAVTARHVVESGASIIRINAINYDPTPGTRHLTHRLIEYEPHEWQFINDGDDIAAIDITEEYHRGIIDNKEDIFHGVNESDFVTREFIGEALVRIGEDAFMLGLFTGNPGKNANHPAARFGNISQLAPYADIVKQGHGISRPSHVFDMHSRPGYSGSPVFAYRTPNTDLSHFTDGRSARVADTRRPHGTFLRLLGIHSGQFIERMRAEKAEADAIVSGDKLAVQSSMTIVSPAWNISTLLDIPYFREIREMREKKAKKDGAPTVQAEVVQADTADDANPQHREDFTRLLNAAVKSRKTDDQT